jgi:hypothetical protein
MTDYANANTEPEDDGTPLAAHNWPDLKPAALQGGCGDIVKAVMPHTEADPAAVTSTLLTTVGCMAGIRPYALAGNDWHPARLHTLICGPTSDGATGTSWSTVRPAIDVADPCFLSENLLSGIVSGEGVIERVRDQVGDDPDDKGFIEGVDDKRLLVLETEYASVLAKGARQGSSLFPVLRQGWDGTTLQSAARQSNALRATGHHISLIGHITPGEFKARLTQGEMDGGSINRLLIVLSRRSKELPDGGNLPDELRVRCGNQVKAALDAAKQVSGRMQRSREAADLWRAEYPRLVAPRPDGWFASATARAQAQVLRLSVAYAILDCSPEIIEVEHLAAALAMWDYAEASAKVLFAEVGYDGRRTDTDKIIEFTRARGKVTRNELREQLFQKHKASHEIDALLKPLIDAGRVAQEAVETKGRTKTVYTLREKRGMRGKHPTSGNGEDFPRNDARKARKVSDGNSQVNGHTAHTAHTAQVRDEAPPGGVTPSTPGMTDRVGRALATGRNNARFQPDPPCFHCGEPVTGKQTDEHGRHAHFDCQRKAAHSTNGVFTEDKS